MPEFFHVASLGEGFLAIMPRPRVYQPLVETFTELAEEGITVVASLLEHDEAHALGLADEESACESAGLEFRSLPIQDHGLPTDVTAVRDLTNEAHARITDGAGWMFHCMAGIGRSGLIAASVLLHEGYDVQAAFALVSAARGLTVPDTPWQREWVERHQTAIVGK